MSSLIPDWLFTMVIAPPPNAELHLHLKPLTLNLEGNVHENFKSHKCHAQVLLERPYKTYNDSIKVAAFLSRTGDKGFQLYNSIN